MKILAAMGLLTEAIDTAMALAQAIKRAGQEGRERLSLDDLKEFQKRDDDIRERLRKEIERQRSLEL
jgi:flavin-dependent dehydrogenase